MKKFKVTYKPTRQNVFIIEAENISQAATRAELKRKEIFDLLANDVSITEYHEPKPE
jgi:hypothetical protein